MQLLDLLPKVLPAAPDCPEPLALEALREAAIALCRTSRLCRRDIAVTYDPGTPGAQVEPPEELQIIAVLRVRTATEELQLLPALPAVVAPGRPAQAAVTQPPAGLVLNPAPPDPLTLTVQAAVAPAAVSLELPPELAGLEGALANGAKAALLVMPGVPWSAPDTGLHYQRLFHRAVDDASASVRRGFIPADLRVRMRPFA